MRKKLFILGFALAAAAVGTLTSSADGPSTGTCPPGTRVVVCADGIHHICCPDNAFCAC